MRFRTHLTNIVTFTKITASLSSLGKICWMRLEDNAVRFTIIPDQGTQVWAQLPVDIIFDSSTYTLQSNSGAINLEVPIGALHRALRSAVGATSAQLRLTKKGNIPLLALTVHASSWTGSTSTSTTTTNNDFLAYGSPLLEDDSFQRRPGGLPLSATAGGRPEGSGPRERETLVTQEIPVKVLHESAVEGLHEPRCRDPDVNVILPSLVQLKSVSDRFTKLAAADHHHHHQSSSAAAVGGSSNAAAGLLSSSSSSSNSPKLELSANMNGCLRLGLSTDALKISSVWSGLVNPPVHTSEMSETTTMGGDEAEEGGWAKVRIDGRDWGRVLSVGRLSPRVVACFIHNTALVLYVYLPGSLSGEESCLTYYINSYAS